MSKQLYRLKDENGQSLILVVLALPMLLALTLLVVDGANLFVQRRAIQNAADSAAFAVANKDLDPNGGCLPANVCKNTLVDYSNKNNGPKAPNLDATLDECGGITNTDVNCYTIEYKNNPSRVKVRLIKSVSTFFGGVASLFSGGGVSSFNVSASAVAGLSPATAAGNVVPIGVNQTRAPCATPPIPGCTPFNTTVTFDFDEPASTHSQAILDLSDRGTSLPIPPGSASNSIMTDWIAFGYFIPGTNPRQPETLPSNTWYGDNNGAKNGLKGNNNTGFVYARDHGTNLLFPVFDAVNPDAPGIVPTAYHVIGFAAFQICGPVLICTGVPDGLGNWNEGGGPDGSNHKLTGQFTQLVASGVGNGGGGQGFGVFVVTLFE